MNKIENKFLLAENKFIPEIHLRQLTVLGKSGCSTNIALFTYSACRPLIKNKERVQKFIQTGDPKYSYRNKLEKAYFQHDMAYDNFKGFSRRKASDKVLHNKSFNIAKNPKYDRYQREITSMVDKFFDKNSEGSARKETGINSKTGFENKRPLG